RRSPGEHGLPGPFVRDDGGARQQAVAVRVVAVVMRVHECPNWTVAHGAHRVEVRLGAPVRRAGVDAHHAAPADEEAGVVDPPAAVGLHVREDSFADLDHGTGTHRASIARYYRLHFPEDPTVTRFVPHVAATAQQPEPVGD